LFLAFATLLVTLSFAILSVETHGKPMLLDSDAGAEEASERPAIAH
jgi:hypothetical protein